MQIWRWGCIIGDDVLSHLQNNCFVQRWREKQFSFYRYLRLLNCQNIYKALVSIETKYIIKSVTFFIPANQSNGNESVCTEWVIETKPVTHGRTVLNKNNMSCLQKYNILYYTWLILIHSLYERDNATLLKIILNPQVYRLLAMSSL